MCIDLWGSSGSLRDRSREGVRRRDRGGVYSWCRPFGAGRRGRRGKALASAKFFLTGWARKQRHWPLSPRPLELILLGMSSLKQESCLVF